MAQALGGACWYEHLGHHFPRCPSAAFDPIPQEGKAFRNLGDLRLFLGKCEPPMIEDTTSFLFHGERLGFCSMTQHHKVVCVTHIEEIALALGSLPLALIGSEVQVGRFHRRVQFMEVYVGQERAPHPTF